LCEGQTCLPKQQTGPNGVQSGLVLDDTVRAYEILYSHNSFCLVGQLIHIKTNKAKSNCTADMNKPT